MGKQSDNKAFPRNEHTRAILREIKQRRPDSKVTMKDIDRYIICKESGDFALCRITLLYIKHSGDYCHMQEVIAKFI